MCYAMVCSATGGSRGALLMTEQIPLTPGPLVVALKGKWPPSAKTATAPSSIETMCAASLHSCPLLLFPHYCSRSSSVPSVMHTVCLTFHDHYLHPSPTTVASAASFVPPTTGSAVRLFVRRQARFHTARSCKADGQSGRVWQNLAVDVELASLSDSKGTSLATGVKYTLGSTWAPGQHSAPTAATICSLVVKFADSAVLTRLALSSVPATQDSFTASASSTDADEGGGLATSTMTPPAAPEVFSAFLLGTKGFGYTLMPQIDAPEQ